MDIQRELHLARALAPIIITSLAPRCAVQIEVQVVQEDGALFAAALNAACLALLDAGVACVAPVAAVTVAVLADGTLLIDPDAREEKVRGGGADLIELSEMAECD